MALFLINKCEYSDCGKIFPTLTKLICHIEQTHLDFDASNIENHENEKPDLPFSYVLKYSDRIIQEDVVVAENDDSVIDVDDTNNTGGNYDNDVVNNLEFAEVSPSFSADIPSSYYTQYSKQKSPIAYNCRITCKINKTQKRYECPVPGCHKKYKNINGIKYHSKNGHDNKDMTISWKYDKDYSCQCGKSYKTAQGLKAHILLQKCDVSYREGNELTTSSKIEKRRKWSRNLPPDYGLINTSANTSKDNNNNINALSCVSPIKPFGR